MNVLWKWYWIMPMLVLWDVNLTANQKLLYCLISSLCAEKWYCRASNKFLWEKLWLQERAISKSIKELADRWYIYSDVNQSKGNERHITIADKPIETEIKQHQLFETKTEKPSKDYSKEMEIIHNLYKSVSPKCKLTDRVKSAIKAFFNAGYSLDDFKNWFEKYYALLNERDANWNKKYFRTYVYDFQSFVSQSNGVRKFAELENLDSYLVKNDRWAKWDKQHKAEFDHSHYSWTEIVL